MTTQAIDPALTRAYETCRRMHRRFDPTYYWATRRLPQEIQPATHALYDELYRGVYRRMYRQLRPLYREIRRITGYPPA